MGNYEITSRKKFYIYAMNILKYAVITLFLLDALPSYSQTESTDKNTISIQGGSMFFSRNETPALLEVMRDKYVDDNQTQSTGIDPSNEQSFWLEGKVCKQLSRNYLLEGRLSFRSFSEGIFVVYSDPNNSGSRTSLIYNTTETHVSGGLSISRFLFLTGNGLELNTYVGLDSRSGQLNWQGAVVQNNSPFVVENPQLDRVLRNYTLRNISVDPLIGLVLSRDPFYIDMRFQRFVKNRLEGENNFFPDYKDALWMTSVGLGVNF